LTVSSHGEDEKEAFKALADSVKEYILTAVENDAINTVFDPAHGKYWRMYNELETRQSKIQMKRSLVKSFKSFSYENIRKSIAEINHV
jgi:hypothetical protein